MRLLLKRYVLAIIAVVGSNMTNAVFILRLIWGVVIIVVAAYSIVLIRSYLLSKWGILIPQPAYQALLLGAVLGGLWLGSGKLIRDLKEAHKNKADSARH